MCLRWAGLVLAMLGVIVLAFAGALTVGAEGPGSAPPAQVGNQLCLACHSNRNLTMKFPSGESLSLYTDGAAYAQSVHGKVGQPCATCHANVTTYPHPPNLAQSARDFALQRYTVCQQCHAGVYRQSLDSVHQKVLAAGNPNAPVCTDCHTAHYTASPGEPRARLAQTCERCHSRIYQEYKGSVHGAALLEQSNPDVPTCEDCHGVHNIGDPTAAAFRLKSPQTCAGCHTDKEKMRPYRLSTNVLNTYIADFHGRTVELFEKQSPDAPTNKAVCYDCHGIHDIRPANDPQSSIFKENILKTCQQCHPAATANFPSAWLSHYDASPDKYPVVYYVNLFYTIFIPLVIGSTLVFVLLDLARRIRHRRKSRSA